ncbi:unnamed protein product [Rotaria sordida]|uniref:Uncharacterized protein n=1 Tax=Rotaria sordida TaxID=392033 RepID=A0A815I4C4_9BILA|nr:unnamed protein product [Rotaria sordida]CAF3861807.1 unnamed protein product [Rotaria sordida]
MECSSNGLIYPMVGAVLERFSLGILPKLHHKIRRLNLESLSMKRILLAGEYPNLCELGLFNIQSEIFQRLFAEKLSLNISVHRSTFIDGNDLNDIISHMPNLKNFICSIHSNVYIDDLIHLPSNQSIQRTLKNLEKYEIVSYTDYFPNDKIGQCHIFSHSYATNSLRRLTNSFPGGLFKFVHEISLYDEHPFEHEFFVCIAQAFPFLKILTIDNKSSQSKRHCQSSNEDNRNLSIVEYHHLIQLRLFTAHDDYIEQFLLDTKTRLSNDIFLGANYDAEFVSSISIRRDSRINVIIHKPIPHLPFNRPCFM